MIKIDTLYLFLRRTISCNYLACTKYKRQDVSFDKFLIGFIHCDRVNLLKIPKIDSIVTQKKVMQMKRLSPWMRRKCIASFKIHDLMHVGV